MPGPANALNISQAGITVFDGVNSFAGRTLTAGTGISITNGSGVSGNPIISSTAAATDLHTAKYIVSSAGTSGTGANYSTITTAINAALAVSIGTFTTGWRLPNIQELFSLLNFGSVVPLNYSPFNLSSTTLVYWTGTNTSSNAYIIANSFALNIVRSLAKTNSANHRYIPTRVFTVTGTTLT